MDQHPHQTQDDSPETTQTSLAACTALELAEGGFTPETEVITTAGLTTIADLSVGDILYVLHPSTRLVKRKPVTAITTTTEQREVVAIETARADLRLAPDHRIPYRTKSRSRLRFTRASALPDQRDYKFIRRWNRPPRERLETVDITDFLVEGNGDYEICASHAGHGHHFRAQLPDGCEPARANSHIGYYFDPQTFKQYQSEIEAHATETTIHAGPNARRRPYRFNGDDFIRLVGWFITEGSVYWPDESQTAQIKFAQETECHRAELAALFERLGVTVHQDDRKFGFGSTVFGTLFETLCGRGSHRKHLPEFVWDLPRGQQRLLLTVLLDGDGNDRGTYYTASDRLANDILQLCLAVGIKPRYTRRRDIWQCFTREVNDGFDSTKHVDRVKTTEPLYRLALEDYAVILAGRNGKFQWVGVSGIT